jgi:hypothetical protein
MKAIARLAFSLSMLGFESGCAREQLPPEPEGLSWANAVSPGDSMSLPSEYLSEVYCGLDRGAATVDSFLPPSRDCGTAMPGGSNRVDVDACVTESYDSGTPFHVHYLHRSPATVSRWYGPVETCMVSTRRGDIFVVHVAASPGDCTGEFQFERINCESPQLERQPTGIEVTCSNWHGFSM